MEHKIIDFHTHAFPDTIAEKTIQHLSAKGGLPPFTDGTAGNLLQTEKQSGVSLSVVLPVVTKPEQFSSITRFAKEINQTFSNKEGSSLLSFGGIHPDSPDYKAELNKLKSLGFKGIKLHPDYQGVDINDIRYLHIIEYAMELDLIVVTHAGIDVGFRNHVRCTPQMVRQVIKILKPKKLVLAHTGGYGLWKEVLGYLAGEDIYFDTAFTMGQIDPEMFVRICRKHGSRKILFATDCPWGNPKADIDTFLSMPLSEEEKENILYKNAERLLDI